jgi:hypothetical protein
MATTQMACVQGMDAFPQQPVQPHSLGLPLPLVQHILIERMTKLVAGREGSIRPLPSKPPRPPVLSVPCGAGWYPVARGASGSHPRLTGTRGGPRASARRSRQQASATGPGPDEGAGDGQPARLGLLSAV